MTCCITPVRTRISYSSSMTTCAMHFSTVLYRGRHLNPVPHHPPRDTRRLTLLRCPSKCWFDRFWRGPSRRRYGYTRKKCMTTSRVVEVVAGTRLRVNGTKAGLLLPPRRPVALRLCNERCTVVCTPGGMRLPVRRTRVRGAPAFLLYQKNRLLTVCLSSYVLPNHYLFQLAESPPGDMAALLQMFQSVPPVVRRRAKGLLDAIRACVQRHLSKSQETAPTPSTMESDVVMEVDTKMDAEVNLPAVGAPNLWSISTYTSQVSTYL